MHEGFRVRFLRGQTIYLEGDPASSLYRVEAGLIRVSKTTPAGRVLTVRHVLPGDYFGEDALTGAHRDAEVEALTDVTLLPLLPASLDVAALQAVTKSLSSQLHRVMGHEYHIQIGDLRERVARYLLELAATPLCERDDRGRPFVRATHELLSQGSNSTRESVSKIVNDLRLEGLIMTGYRRVTLLDVPGLRRVADGSERPQ